MTHCSPAEEEEPKFKFTLSSNSSNRFVVKFTVTEDFVSSCINIGIWGTTTYQYDRGNVEQLASQHYGTTIR